jgi:hypothetical protein
MAAGSQEAETGLLDGRSGVLFPAGQDIFLFPKTSRPALDGYKGLFLGR